MVEKEYVIDLASVRVVKGSQRKVRQLKDIDARPGCQEFLSKVSPNINCCATVILVIKKTVYGVLLAPSNADGLLLT